MVRSTDTARPLIPAHPTLQSLRAAAAGCRACPLWERGTQTVFGEGPEDVPIMLIGEGPGDSEDKAGRPFVGPAGKLLDRALADAGIDRAGAYVTNVVKHFAWEPRGDRRVPRKPAAPEIRACLPWLEAEIALVRPRALVCLGSVAAQALFGRDFRVTVSRGQLLSSPLAPIATATLHPAALLRMPDAAARQAQIRLLVDDLANVRAAVTALGTSAPEP